MPEPIVIAVTGAAGQIGYSLLPRIIKGDMLGSDVSITLKLLDITPALPALGGVALELADMASPLLHECITTDDPKVAFKHADIVIMLGAFPRKAGMERKDLLAKNVAIFRAQGAALAEVAKPSVKVVVVGNPANTNAAIAAAAAGDALPSTAWSALTRLDHNRALAQLAAKAGVSTAAVRNVVIWGNHSSTQFPDATPATIDGKSAGSVIDDAAWLKGDFITTVQKRGAAIVEARKLSSAMSAANAIVDHVRDWVKGTPEGTTVSMGLVVPKENPYGITADLVYSFPVTCANGIATIVPGIPLDEFAKQKMKETEDELLEERATALQILKAAL